MYSTRGLIKPAGIAFIAIACIAAAHADFKDLLGRIPGEANAIVIIDVEKALNSPLGMREKWKEMQANAYADKPLIVPPGATKVVMAALIDPSTVQSVWEVSAIDLSQPVSIDTIARAEGGYTETLADKAAAWSPINAYFVALDKQVLGAITPANRQFASRWARQKQTLGGAFVSTFLRVAATGIDQGGEIVMALDLEDIISEKRVTRRIQSGDFESLVGKKFDIKALTAALASVKGISLRVDIGEEIVGKGTIEFGNDAAPLKDIAKPVLLEILAKSGMYIEEFNSFTVNVSGKRVTAEGKLTSNGLRRLLSVIQPPSPLTDAPPAPAAPSGGAAQQPNDPPPAANSGAPNAKASQQYYRAIVDILDKLGKEVGTGAKSASLSQSANWMTRDAKRIERLPILNVDPELVTWGGDVASRLKEAASVFSVGQLATHSRTSSIGDYATYSTDEYTSEDAVRPENIDRERRAAAYEEKARATETALKMLGDLQVRRNQLRQALTERYKVEF